MSSSCATNRNIRPENLLKRASLLYFLYPLGDPILIPISLSLSLLETRSLIWVPSDFRIPQEKDQRTSHPLAFSTSLKGRPTK